MRTLCTLIAAAFLFVPSALHAQCGGVERWAVKVAADPDAALIDTQNVVVATLDSLVNLDRPALPHDDVTRATEERNVRTVYGWLMRFKHETGKSGDRDYHLVISDATHLFSPSGTGSQASPHSLVAEIPDPTCVGGRDGAVTGPSAVQARLQAVRTTFEQQFPNVHSGWNDVQGIPVRVTGVVFFDRPHGQVGRALNGLELHPLLDIEFNPDTTGAPPIVVTELPLANPDFEAGDTGWTATDGVITSSADEPAHSGQWKAWLGGYGEEHTDRLSQRITLPATAQAVSLTFFLHIDTEENNTQPYDKLRIWLRGANGQFLRTLKRYTNQNAAPGFAQQSVDLTEFKGQTVRIEFEATEDDGSVTSFVVDDVAVVAQGE